MAAGALALPARRTAVAALALWAASIAPAGEPWGGMILNEYSAVAEGKYLEHAGADRTLGRREANGGNWLELVVARDLDARGYRLAFRDDAGREGAIVLAESPLWSNLRAGTILTFIDRPSAAGGLDSDLSYAPEDGDWRVHVCCADEAGGEQVRLEGTLEVSNENWSLTIRDASGRTVCGPVGEGAPGWSGGGVGSEEAAALLEDPRPGLGVEAAWADVSETTLGLPNRWERKEVRRVQDFAPLRAGRALQTESPVRPAMRLRRIDTVDVPAHACEIIAWCASQRLLLSTNALWKTLDIFEADSLNPPRLRALDFCPSEPWVGGFWTVGEPTSVAVHPKEPVAFVTALSRLRHRRGRLTAFDLRAGSRGRTLFDLEVGYHPDSVAVSPDGRWAIVACEAECHPDLPGTICAVDLSGLKLDGEWRPDPEACFELTDMAERLDVPSGELEPEFVAFDPASRFAVVTCQENDAAFLVDVRGGRPEVAGVIFLGFLSRPDGAAVLDDIPGPDGRRGCLIAIAEEGGFDAHAGRICGQALTCFWVDPEDLARPVQVSRVDVRPLLDPEEPQKRRDPEGVSLVRLGTRIYGALAVERGDRLMCFDLSDPTAPDLVGAVRIGDRPEGLIAIPDGEGVLFVTGEEGKYGPGTLSFTRLEPVE